MNPTTLQLPKPFNLSGRVAMITGGSGLLGSQHALALAEIGASVVIADIDMDAPATRTTDYRLSAPYGERCRLVRAALEKGGHG